MQGLFTYLENSTGHYLSEVIQSFRRSDNKDIADTLIELRETLENFGLSFNMIRENLTNTNTELYSISSFSLRHENILEENPDFEEKIGEIDKKLNDFIEKKEFWNNVTKYVQRNIYN